MKQLLMQPALWLCVSMISYPDYWCFNKDTTFLHNSTILPHSEKRETALEPFPFQLIFVISSEVCFHHLLPGLVSDGDIGFQGIDNTKRVFPQFCGPQFCGSMVALPGGAGSRLSRQTAAHRRRLWATGTPIPVRQGPISAYGAPQSLAQRAEPASRCGCLATVRVTSRKQGRHLQKWAKMKVTYPKQGRHPQSAPFPFPKQSHSICRTKRKKPSLPIRNNF